MPLLGDARASRSATKRAPRTNGDRVGEHRQGLGDTAVPMGEKASHKWRVWRLNGHRRLAGAVRVHKARAALAGVPEGLGRQEGKRGQRGARRAPQTSG